VPTRYPIILAHGICRLDFLRASLVNRLPGADENLSDRFHYFRGIRTALRNHGYAAHHTSVGFADGVEVRSRQLRDQLLTIMEKENADKVHIVGHSMGGLDARHMVVDLEMADRVASITTIGTPHLGTTLADKAVRRGGKQLGALLRPIIHLEGFRDLTTAECLLFNSRAEASEAANSVRYSVVSCHQKSGAAILPLQISGAILARTEGPNDGLVSVTSQEWTAELRGPDGMTKAVSQWQFPINGDHVNEMGWWDGSEGLGLLTLARLPRKIREMETAVRGVYLGIAEKLTDGPL